MSQQRVLDFLQACVADGQLEARLSSKSLPELMLHAKSAGFRFTTGEFTGVIGQMEASMIMQKMGEPINAYSSLWPRMWGKPRLQYVVHDLFAVFAPHELAEFAK